MAITIKLDRKRSLRLAEHLEKEHPSVKGKILVSGRNSSVRRKKITMGKKLVNVRGFLRKIPGKRKKVLIKPMRRKAPK